ncbi:MAG: class I SAM-dependent methyltransferase [Verrucomicrobiota bacterium]
MSSTSISQDFVFKENAGGLLEFIGDFESLYQYESDPWGQSGTDSKLKNYYQTSRNLLIEKLTKNSPASILEVGCGHGYVCNTLKNAFPQTTVEGIDISALAITKACETFPHLTFHHGNISAKDTLPEKQYDAVILNQILWYILEDFDSVLDNSHHLLKPEGKFYSSNAFFKKEQRYGTEIINGFDGLIQYLTQKTETHFSFEYASLQTLDNEMYNNGLVTMKKIPNPAF